MTWVGFVLSRKTSQVLQFQNQVAHFLSHLRGDLGDAEVEAAKAEGVGLDLAATFDEIAARTA